MSALLRVAVVGVGHLGQHHARLLATMPDVTLTGVVDLDPERAESIALRCSTAVLTLEDLARVPLDAVVVAVSTDAHFSVVEGLLLRGVHVLVEKPLTATVDQADRLIALAERLDLTLAVGHTERFNPAIVATLPRIKRPRFIEAHRLGTFPDRSLDIDVVFDLMIHDLDLVLTAVGEPVVAIEAIGVPVLTSRVDIANVRLRFAGGCIANLTASRISRDRVRKIRFFQPEAYVSVDCASQEAEAWQLVEAGGGRTIEGGKLDVANEEPLKRELEDFVAAVRHRRAPGVTAVEGRAALALAAAIADRMDIEAMVASGVSSGSTIPVP